VVENYGAASVADPYDAPELGSHTAIAAAEREYTDAEERLQRENAHYVVEVLKPRAKPCWTALSGSGEIEFRYTWIVEDHVARPVATADAPLSVTIYETSLEPEIAQQALDCMLDAVDGTTFELHLMSGEPDGEFVFYQRWHVGS
jgi:hypothetical protein